jgi:dTDP-glucose 4,6-dehydratase/UDP-glucose 4-epimerase
MKKILVVGSKGFIGRNCVKHFKDRYDVWECDVILDYNNPKYIAIDSVDSDFLEVFQREHFDICINCSGAASVPFSMEKPFNDFRLNTLNVFKLLEAIRTVAPDCKFIMMSSAAVYGNPHSLPITEQMLTLPVSPYGYHKVMAEQVCEEYSRFWNIKTCCLRIFSAYGAGLRKQIMWDLYNKFTAKDDNIVKLWGTGNETRDFIHVKDIVRSMELVISYCDFKGNIINVANGEQVKISTLANIFKSVLQSDKKIKFNNITRPGDPLNWEANIDILKSYGYQKTVELKDGINDYIRWIKGNE